MTNSDSEQQAKLAEWLPWREEYLDELLCSDGLDSRPLVCVACQRPGNTWCVDCCGQDIFCDTCLLVLHSWLPLHRVEVCFFIAITSYIPYQLFTPSDGMVSTLVLTFSEHLASLCSWVVTCLVSGPLYPKLSTCFEGARLTQLVQLVTAGRLFPCHEG